MVTHLQWDVYLCMGTLVRFCACVLELVYTCAHSTRIEFSITVDVLVHSCIKFYLLSYWISKPACNFLFKGVYWCLKPFKLDHMHMRAHMACTGKLFSGVGGKFTCQ